MSRSRGPGSYYRGNGGTYAYNQRGNFAGGSARPGNFERPAFEGPNAPRTNGINRGAESFNRGYQPSYNGYTHAENPAYAHPSAPGQQAYNRVAPQSAFGNRAQQAYSNPGYGYRPDYPNRTQTYASRPAAPAFSNPGYGYANRSTQAYAARPGYGATSSYSSYRAPQFDSRAYGARSNPSYGNSYARNESGGFRGFGGEKAPKLSAQNTHTKNQSLSGIKASVMRKPPKLLK